jgi:uncharacterized protein YwgA
MQSENLISLRLVLDHLDVPATSSTLPERKRLQKVIYLAQAAGAELGYRFSWYLMGPYSSVLTRDYFTLGPEVDEQVANYRLTEQVQAALGKVTPLLEVPQGIHLAQADWLELVASLLFLQRDSMYSKETAYARLAQTKPNLRPHADEAQEGLEAAELI